MSSDHEDNEFSIRAMKQAFEEVTDKRVSEPIAEDLGIALTDFCSDIAVDAVERADEKNRKTVRAYDVSDVSPINPKRYAYSVPDAPFERVIRKNGGERVSGNAVEELNETGVAYIMELAKEANRMANHANRKTLKSSDLKMALDNRDRLFSQG